MKRIRLHVAFIAATALVMLLSTGSGRAAEGSDSSNEKLDRVAVKIQSVLDTIDKHLSKGAAAMSVVDLKSDAAKAILEETCAKSDHFTDCAIIDPNGIILSIYPQSFHRSVGADISDQKHFIKLKRERKPVLGEEFKAVEGFYAVEFGYPILSNKKKFVGAVSVIVKPSKFVKEIVKPELGRDATNVWVMEDDGQIIYSRHEKVIGGNPARDDTYVGRESLLTLLKEVLRKRSGTMSYQMKPKGSAAPRTKTCHWKTVGLHGTEWRVLLFGREYS